MVIGKEKAGTSVRRINSKCRRSLTSTEKTKEKTTKNTAFPTLGKDKKKEAECPRYPIISLKKFITILNYYAMTKTQLLEQYFTDISSNGSFWDFSYNNLNYTISDYILSNLLLYGSHNNWKSNIIERAKIVESIYIIRNYDMIGANFKTFEKLNFDKVEKINDVFRCVKNNETEYWNSGKYYTISQKPEGENYNKIFLPYFADVTEDINIPKELKRKGLKPKTYKNCQLITYKKGGYYYFYDHIKKGELLISMNSHTYKPINN